MWDFQSQVPKKKKKKKPQSSQPYRTWKRKLPSNIVSSILKIQVFLELVGIQLRQLTNISYLLVHGIVNTPTQYSSDKGFDDDDNIGLRECR